MLPVPVFIPLTVHWYKGAVPGLFAIAVNVTGVPVHTGLALAEMEILTGMFGKTVTVTEAQPDAPHEFSQRAK